MSLLEQEWVVSGNSKMPSHFLEQKFGLSTPTASNAVNKHYPLNGDSGVGFYGKKANTSTSNSDLILLIEDKRTNRYNGVTGNNFVGSIFYHISKNKSVKYFKYVNSAENSYTYILAEDVKGEWVVFNGDKMYSDYGETGIYNNPQTGRSELVNGGNQFLISKACRLDTGEEFKELYFVQSARSYTDTNCIVDYGGKTYRLVSVSNVKDETGRYPAFAFPVSD